jgi:F-type H+-transporting ATPase subunit b
MAPALASAAVATPIAQEPEAQEHAEAAQEPAAEEHASEGAQEPDGEHAPADEHGDDEHGAAGEHGEEHEETTWGEYAMKWINFVLLLGLLYWLLVVPPAFVRENFEFDGLKEIWVSRSEAILAASALAKEQREEAERSDRESAERLAAIEQEASELVATAREEAGRDGERIAAAAVAEAEKIRSGASRDMNAEVERARRTLRAHVADLTVSIATGMVRDNISADDQERMVRRYLDRLGESVS